MGLLIFGIMGGVGYSCGGGVVVQEDLVFVLMVYIIENYFFCVCMGFGQGGKVDVFD